MSGTHGIFSHRTGYFYTILEEDFCEVFKGAGKNEVCRAYITSILEHLTNKHYDPEKHGETIWVYMSLPEMARRMRNAYSERTIHKEIQGMIADGFMEKRRAAGKATMEYRLNAPKIAHALAHLPEKQPCNSATYHLAVLQEPSSKTATSILQNDKVNLAELQPRYTSRLPKDIPVEQGESIAPTYTQPAPLSDIALAHPTPLPLSVFADENLHVDMPPLSTQRVVLSAREGVAEPVAMLNDEADRAVIAHMLSQQGNPNSVFYLPPAPTQPVLAPVADIAAPQEDNAVTVTTEPLPRNPIAAAAASSLTPDVDIQTETPAGKKPPKGKGAKVTPDQKARMGKVMNYIDSLLQEVTGDPDEGYSRTTKIGQDALYTLLFGRKHSERRVTQERVRKVFLAMWNEPRNTRTGYYLRENMGYNKICEEYEKRIHSLIAEENGKGKGAATSNGIIDLVEWQGRKMSQAEAKKLGYTGFEKYIGNGPDDLAELDRITANSPEIQALIREALEA